MSTTTFSPVPVETFGSWVTQVKPSDVAVGLSPDCRDVEFFPGRVRTRPGLSLPFSVISGSVKVNALKSFITLDLTQRLLVLTSDGRLFSENPSGTLLQIDSGLAVDAYMKSDTLFGREYMAFSDGKEGIDFPRHFDDTNVDRVTQEGPGAGPTAVDGAAGVIPAGVHKYIVWFVLRSGARTRPSPPKEWTAAGVKKVDLTVLPVGPDNVASREVAFTVAGGASYFHIDTSMVVPDNTATTLTVDFSTVQLTSGENVDHLLRNEVLPNSAGVIGYASRLVWWGEENYIQSFNNLQFDGGFASGGEPLGWTQGPNFAGGAKESSDVAWGEAWKITGDGATVNRGEIRQSIITDAFLSKQILFPAKAYRVRARVKRSSGLAAGTLNIDLFGSGLDTVGLTVGFGAASTTFAEFEAELTPSQTSLPSDATFRIFVNGTPTSGEFFIVDDIRIFESGEPAKTSLLRISRVNQPEGYDGTDGLLEVRRKDGQAIRNAFELRDFLYIVKERSLHVTRDDGSNEPNRWSVQRVDKKVGTPSIHGVGFGEGWVIIAGRPGAYLFSGGKPVKLSQEIQPTWDGINWAQGHKIWVVVDNEAKRVYFGVPIGAATEPDRILTLDYTRGWGDPLSSPENARKWAPWFISANSAGLIERATGKAQLFLGNNAANGKIYELDSTATEDDTAAINSYYRTAHISRAGRNGQPTPSGRSLFGYLTMFCTGVGTLNLSAFPPGDVGEVTLTGLTLADPKGKDLELVLNISTERLSFKFGTNATSARFEMTQFVPYAKKDPWAPVRGLA